MQTFHSVRDRVPIAARFAAASLGLLLLGGCFLAEGDEDDPIIPDAALVYPMKPGDAKQCKEEDGAEPECVGARIARRQDGGYDMTVSEPGEDGDGSTKGYRIRRLQGEGVPPNAFLVQLIDDNPGSRYLGLLRRRPDGGWNRFEPQCDQLEAVRFVDFMKDGWISTEPGQNLKNLTCYIGREGLSDGRLYAILSGGSGDSAEVIYDNR